MELQTSKCFSETLFPTGIWPLEGPCHEGGGRRHFWRIPGYSFICVLALGGEEKAGFGAQPRDFDTILPCPGDISNNIRGCGASNFKVLLRNPIPHWYLDVQGLDAPRLEGGVCTLKNSQAIHLYVYGRLGAKKKQGSGRSPEIFTPYCHAQGTSATT